MSMYEIGDRIKIEKAPDRQWPRWQFDSSSWIDMGYTGEYFDGRIINLGAAFVKVHLGEPNKDWSIPVDGHYGYVEGQFDLPGFYENLSYQIRQRKSHGCSCGAWSMYGEDWDEHDGSCSYYDTEKRSGDTPKNNDGRVDCWHCTRPTINMGGYQICNHSDCRWYQK